ncbi:MAG TPA: thermonuclease family protein [Paludibaculum sp.]|jgi:endonuclease YncB( thermonuclease family)
MTCDTLLVRVVTIAALAVPLAHAQKTEFTAEVVGVTEGDILRVKHNGAEEKIRLQGIDCPEMNQTFGPQAKKFTRDLAVGKSVTVKVFEVDRFKRQVADIILPDGKNLNQEIVKAGYAWWFVRYAKNDRVLEKLEAEAKQARRGLWSQELPTPPWEHRKHGRGAQ